MSIAFPRWLNVLPTLGAVCGIGGLITVVVGGWYYATPDYFQVGYMPAQPGTGFNHQLHAGKLGMDCRYCHSHVESSAEANIPPVSTCYGCHAEGHLQLPEAQHKKSDFVRTAFLADESIPWRRVHKVPDYVRNFPHDIHVAAGVSCYSCHGQVTAMPVVFQAHSLSMGWCLDCHRSVDEAPEKYLVPKDKVTQLQWVQEEWMANPEQHKATAAKLLEALKNAPPENCGACHY